MKKRHTLVNRRSIRNGWNRDIYIKRDSTSSAIAEDIHPTGKIDRLRILFVSCFFFCFLIQENLLFFLSFLFYLFFLEKKNYSAWTGKIWQQGVQRFSVYMTRLTTTTTTAHSTDSLQVNWENTSRVKTMASHRFGVGTWNKKNDERNQIAR